MARYEEVKLPPLPLPPMVDEPNQAEIDEESAKQLQSQTPKKGEESK